jgi:predicted nucleic acid-binding protein
VIVYVETNFLLELAYMQESYESCQEILRLAGSRSISLVLPACCITESYLTWHRKNTERQQFHTQLQAYLAELSRSAPNRGLADQYREAMAALIAGSDESRDRLLAAIASVGADGEMIPVTTSTMLMVGLHEDAHSLSPQDALVLASVKSHSETRAGRKCFVTKDRNFARKCKESAELSVDQCDVLNDFAHALSYIKSALDNGGRTEVIE